MRLGTKNHQQRYEEQARKLIRPNPKVKPPRHDLRNERIDTDSDPDADDASDAKDRSKNYKTIGGAEVARRFLARRRPGDRTPAVNRETGKVVMISPSTLKEQPGKYGPVKDNKPDSGDFRYPDAPGKAQAPETPAEKPPEEKPEPKKDEDYFYGPPPGFTQEEFDKELQRTKHKKPAEPTTDENFRYGPPPEFNYEPKEEEQEPKEEEPEAVDPEEWKSKESEPEPDPVDEKPVEPKQTPETEAPTETPEASPEAPKPEPEAAPAPEEVEAPKVEPEPEPKSETPKAEPEGAAEGPPEEASKKKPAPKKEPKPISEAEKAGIEEPKRKPVNTADRAAALNTVVATFPPEMASKVIGLNLHPSDMTALCKRFLSAKKSLNIENPSEFAEKMAGVYQTNPSKIAPPKEWKGQALDKMAPDEKAEAYRQHQLQRLAVSFAAKDGLTKKLLNAGSLTGKPTVPKKMAATLASLMLRSKKDADGDKEAAKIFDLALKEAPLKMSNSAVKKLLSQVKANPVASKVAVAWMQGSDFQLANEKFKKDGSFSEWDSPGAIVRNLRKSGEFFAQRNGLYGKNYEESPSAKLYRNGIMNRLRSLNPKRFAEVEKGLQKVRTAEYAGLKKAWNEQYKTWEQKQVGPPPEKPEPPVGLDDESEDEESVWDSVLSHKTASDSTYSDNTVMGSKSAVYHGVAPVAVTYPGWEQPHQREFGDAEAKKVLAEAKSWLSAPVLAAAVGEGAVPDTKFRAALDYALVTTNHKVNPVQYNELLAKLAGEPAPSESQTLLTKQADAAPTKEASPYTPKPGMRASSEIRKFASKVEDIKLAFDMLAFADHLADEEDKTRQEDEAKVKQASEAKTAAEAKLSALRKAIIRSASQLSPATQVAIKPLLQALKDLD